MSKKGKVNLGKRAYKQEEDSVVEKENKKERIKEEINIRENECEENKTEKI